jgi:hypothetical protein
VTDSTHSRVISEIPEAKFLEQSELKALQSGLKYKEERVDKLLTYKGYVNQNGEWEGVGMRERKGGFKDYGEWHMNKRNGCVLVKFAEGEKYWG